jgi:maltose alpha-D-glucosyltransferase/alpha-amylase
LQTALQTSPGNLPPEAVELATTLLTHREALLERIQLLSGDPALFGQRIRIHGDFHLGQLLRVETKSHADFLIIDFEGEPARPFEERRHKQSPLRDVAGMLRSFSYAARSALQTAVQRTPANAVALEAWATTWETAVSDVFLRNYRSTLSINPALLPPPSAQDPAEHSAPALSALLLEKAFYELLYELNNRPTWLVIPLKGLLAIARDGA